MRRAAAVRLCEADLGFPTTMCRELAGGQRARAQTHDGVGRKDEGDVRIGCGLQNQPSRRRFEVLDRPDERGFGRRCGALA